MRLSAALFGIIFGTAISISMPLIQILDTYVFNSAPEPAISQPVQSATPTIQSSPTVMSEIPATQTDEATPVTVGFAQMGTLLFSAREAGYRHIWGYVPGDRSPLQLTFGPYDDLDPAASPDGTKIAFSSNRDGYWDLYILDLVGGEVRRLTDTDGYEGSPAWSPDGAWLAYETYYDNQYDIWLMGLEGDETLQLTNHPGNDLSPTWDYQGRLIAFISDRDGQDDLFIADLDQTEDRFLNLTSSTDIIEKNPRFSPSGDRIAYAGQIGSVSSLMLIEARTANDRPTEIGRGDLPAWSPTGEVLTAVEYNPYDAFLVSFRMGSAQLPTIGIPLKADISGLSWGLFDLAEAQNVFTKPILQPPALYEQAVTAPLTTGDRYALVDLPGVPGEMKLSDTVDEAFNALRARIGDASGWDFLGELENAYVGINDPLPPGYSMMDWLYTGRAFTISEAVARSGWVEVLREEFDGRTYWRIFVRTRQQDGSAGEPVKDYTWDFGARFSGDPTGYDQGGVQQSALPAGYYVDFTGLASDYGFQRLPALANWRTYYAGARFTEFAYTDDLDWYDAMLEIYPPNAIVTATPFHTPTVTPTRTPVPTVTPWWNWQTATPSPVPATATPLTPTPTPPGALP
jgi:TolB protein